MLELQSHLEFTRAQAERLVGSFLGEPVACTALQRLDGGKVNTVVRIEFDRPPHAAVVKLRRLGDAGFSDEVRSLRYLRANTNCPAPDVLLHDESGVHVPFAALLLEHIPGVCLEDLELAAVDRRSVAIGLAGLLGELHQHTRPWFGPVDGADVGRSWPDIVAARLETVRRHPGVEARLSKQALGLVDRAIELAPRVLDAGGPPTLVHGDVWDGNVMVQRHNGAWHIAALLDPSLEYADVEMELAYLEVFDTPRPDFFAAYENGAARRTGYERRRLFYWLHTALVHVALFGDDLFCDFAERTSVEITEVAS